MAHEKGRLGAGTPGGPKTTISAGSITRAALHQSSGSGRVRLEDVRARLEDLDTVARLLGVEVRSARGGLVRCVFHDDRTPSLSIFPSSQGGWAGRCHGCDARGDALALIGRRLGIGDFGELLDELGRHLGIAPGPRRKLPPVRPRPQVLEVDPVAAREVQDRAHRVLLEVAPMGREGRDYLVARGFLEEEIPDDWAELPPPAGQRRVVDALVEAVGEDGWRLSGLAQDGDPTRFAAPQNRLVLPWAAGPGVLAPVALLQRRRLDGGRPKYIAPRNVPRAPFPFGIEDLGEVDGPETTIVFVEGALDVVAVRILARERGLDWLPLGIPGVEAWMRDWADLARDRDAIVALDDDPGGERHVADIAADLLEAGARTITRRAPTGGKDWLETLRAMRERG